MGIRDFGEWKSYAAQRFVGILHLTVLNADKTRSAIPAWAKSMIKIGWNIEEPGSVKLKSAVKKECVVHDARHLEFKPRILRIGINLEIKN